VYADSVSLFFFFFYFFFFLIFYVDSLYRFQNPLELTQSVTLLDTNVSRMRDVQQSIATIYSFFCSVYSENSFVPLRLLGRATSQWGTFHAGCRYFSKVNSEADDIMVPQGYDSCGVIAHFMNHSNVRFTTDNVVEFERVGDVGCVFFIVINVFLS
jgi:hypothetical protein